MTVCSAVPGSAFVGVGIALGPLMAVLFALHSCQVFVYCHRFAFTIDVFNGHSVTVVVVPFWMPDDTAALGQNVTVSVTVERSSSSAVGEVALLVAIKVGFVVPGLEIWPVGVSVWAVCVLFEFLPVVGLTLRVFTGSELEDVVEICSLVKFPVEVILGVVSVILVEVEITLWLDEVSPIVEFPMKVTVELVSVVLITGDVALVLFRVAEDMCVDVNVGPVNAVELPADGFVGFTLCVIGKDDVDLGVVWLDKTVDRNEVLFVKTLLVCWLDTGVEITFEIVLSLAFTEVLGLTLCVLSDADGVDRDPLWVVWLPGSSDNFVVVLWIERLVLGVVSFKWTDVEMTLVLLIVALDVGIAEPFVVILWTDKLVLGVVSFKWLDVETALVPLVVALDVGVAEPFVGAAEALEVVLRSDVFGWARVVVFRLSFRIVEIWEGWVIGMDPPLVVLIAGAVEWGSGPVVVLSTVGVLAEPIGVVVLRDTPEVGLTVPVVLFDTNADLVIVNQNSLGLLACESNSIPWIIDVVSLISEDKSLVELCWAGTEALSVVIATWLVLTLLVSVFDLEEALGLSELRAVVFVACTLVVELGLDDGIESWVVCTIGDDGEAAVPVVDRTSLVSMVEFRPGVGSIFVDDVKLGTVELDLLVADPSWPGVLDVEGSDVKISVAFEVELDVTCEEIPDTEVDEVEVSVVTLSVPEPVDVETVRVLPAVIVVVRFVITVLIDEMTLEVQSLLQQPPPGSLHRGQHPALLNSAWRSSSSIVCPSGTSMWILTSFASSVGVSFWALA
jgi:hypothetical protein